PVTWWRGFFLGLQSTQDRRDVPVWALIPTTNRALPVPARYWLKFVLRQFRRDGFNSFGDLVGHLSEIVADKAEGRPAERDAIGEAPARKYRCCNTADAFISLFV